MIDALVADPYDEEARKRAKELGITGKQVKEERKKKSSTCFYLEVGETV